MTYFDRIKNALLEIFVFLPLSAIIFVLVWLPIGMLISFASGAAGEMGAEVWIMLPIVAIVCYGVAFLISRLRMMARGYKTDLTHQSFWGNQSTDIYGNTHFDGIYETPSLATVAAILLSFVSLPLGIVAAIASLLGLIYPGIYSTPGIIETTQYTKVNQVLHALFDFVISPTGYERPRRPSPLGLVNLLSPVLTVGIVVGAMWIAGELGPLYTIPEWAQIILLLVSLLVLITLVASAIIDTVLLCRSFTPEQARDNAARAIILLVLFAAAFLPMAFSL